MAQIPPVQLVPPDAWRLVGPETARQVELTAPQTVAYANGGSDSLPANTPAVGPSSAASWDGTQNEVVPYVTKGDPTLRFIPVAQLGTLTADYAPLGRAQLHEVVPYQPDPYLETNGLGNAPQSGVSVASTPGQGVCFVLGTEPAGWQQPTFSDASWSPTLTPTSHWATTIGGTGWITYFSGAQPYNTIWLHRRTFTVPSAIIVGATLQINGDNQMIGVWLNGTLLLTTSWGGVSPGPAPVSLTVPTALLVPGAVNCLAVKTENGPPGGVGTGPWESAVDYLLTVSCVPSGGVGAAGTWSATTTYHPGDLVTDGGSSWTSQTANTNSAPSSMSTDWSVAAQGSALPSGVEGDLLLYHAGAWSALAPGASGQVLTMAGTDPTWTAPRLPITDHTGTAVSTTTGDLIAG